MGDEVGRTLTAWRGGSAARGTVTSGAAVTGSGGEGGVVQRETEALGSLINVRLEGATQYELVEVFGKVLHTVRGVTEASTYRITVVPGNPQASLALWRARIEDTTTFRLQSNVMTMLKSICEAGGELVLRGVDYRYTPAEVDLLKGVFPYDVTSREFVFLVDRERVRDLEMRGVECGYDSQRSSHFLHEVDLATWRPVNDAKRDRGRGTGLFHTRRFSSLGACGP